MNNFVEFLVNLFTNTNENNWTFVSSRPGKADHYKVVTYHDNTRNQNVCMVVHNADNKLYTWFLENDVIHFGLCDTDECMVTFATKSSLDASSDEDIEFEEGIEEEIILEFGESFGEILLEFGMPKEFLNSEAVEGYYYTDSLEKTKTFLESIGFVHDENLDKRG